MNIVFALKSFILMCSFQAFAIDYYNERDKFHKCFFSQVLANGFGTETDFSFKNKFEAIKDFREKIKDFPEDPGINELDACGMAPLHYLSMSRVYDIFDGIYIKKICNIFIELGADINLPNLYGVTPLRFAANYGNYAVVETFLEKGGLKRDFSIIELLFSPKLHPFDLYYSDIIISGKLGIWRSIKKVWFSNYDQEKLRVINSRISEILKWSNNSSTSEFERQTKNRALAMHLGVIYETLTESDDSKRNWIFIDKLVSEKESSEESKHELTFAVGNGILKENMI